MSRLQQKRSGRRETRRPMAARDTRLALDSALSHLGISLPPWGGKLPMQIRNIPSELYLPQ